MYDSSIFIKSEMDYRANRARNAIAVRKRGRGRFLRVRRPTDESDSPR